jgi:nucleoid-associated protein YgaU
MMQSVLVPPGTTLFQISAQYLGTATQWFRIARLNGLKDPLVLAPTILIIPPIRTAGHQDATID